MALPLTVLLHPACMCTATLSCVQVTARDSLAGRTIALWARQADAGAAEQDAAVRKVALRWRTRAMHSRAEEARAAAVAAPHWKLLVQLSNCNAVREAHVLQCDTHAAAHGVLTADGMLEVSLRHGSGLGTLTAHSILLWETMKLAAWRTRGCSWWPCASVKQSGLFQVLRVLGTVCMLAKSLH